MKTIYSCIAMFCALFLFSACNEDSNDEHYTHMISFKAPINSERVADIYLRYKPQGEVIYNLPVLVSGSTLSGKSFDVRVGVDNDTLAILNDAKYQYRTDLFYKQLEEQFYEFISPTCHIPAGSNKELFQVKFKFDGLNLSEEWVLPLTIEEDPSYVTNKRKGWRKALLHILPYNDYSGNYSASAMNIYFDDSKDDPLVADKRKARVVDENTIFFYAGTKQDDAIDRGTYKINVKFEEAVLQEDGVTKKGDLTVTAEHADQIHFQVIGKPTYEIQEKMDPNQPYLMRRHFIIYLSYKYDDVTSVPENPTTYRAEGSMLMERQINILIPDDDQAILW